MIRPELLVQFQSDIHTRETFMEFLFEVIDTEALNRLYKREDATGMADAREIIVEAFAKLEREYGERKQEPTHTNHAA